MKQVFILTLFVLLLGCENANQDPNVIDFADDDKAMNGAIEKAQNTFGYFIDHWQDEGVNYSLKIAVPTDGGSFEHIWFNPTKITGNDITAICANDPRDVSGLKAGDVRSYTVSDVSDWMIVVGEKCYGGYTIRVAIQQDPGLKESLPYEFVEIN